MSEAAPGPAPKRKRPSGDTLRWQAFFQHCDEPLFFLNRRRRVLFVNRAWEQLAGLPASEAHNLVCTQTKPGNPGDSLKEILTHALCPPAEVLQGRGGRTRRLLPGRSVAQRWWDVEFFPLREAGNLLGILGRITPVRTDEPAGSAPFPEKLVTLRESVAERSNFDLLLSPLPALHRLVEQVRLASRTDVPVLIVGEPGTGKRTLARLIHFQGARRERSFAALDCRRLPAFAVAGWLFGHSTASRESVSTVYLSEPAALPRDLQLRLCELLVKQSETTSDKSLRILAGSCEQPAQQVRAGQMLEELACNLSTLVLEVPPLRHRPDDLPLFVENLIERANADEGTRIVGLTDDAWELVRGYSWPGNLHELHTVLVSARLRAQGDRIEAADLPAALRLTQGMKETSGRKPGPSLPLDQLLEQAERRLIELALRQAKGKKNRAAELLAIWRQRLVRRMEALGIVDVEGESSGS